MRETTSKSNNVSTTHGNVQPARPTSQTNNVSTTPGHAKSMVSELNNYSDSTVTEHTDENTQQITGL